MGHFAFEDKYCELLIASETQVEISAGGQWSYPFLSFLWVILRPSQEPDYTVSNGSMIEGWIVKDLEGSGLGLIEFLRVIFLERLKKTTKRLQSYKLMFRPRFNQSISGVQIQSFTTALTCSVVVSKLVVVVVVVVVVVKQTNSTHINRNLMLKRKLSHLNSSLSSHLNIFESHEHARFVVFTAARLMSSGSWWRRVL
jgi:hypothetical protein